MNLMAVAAGLAFGAAIAVYLLSHFDGRIKNTTPSPRLQ
jgi:hypothetical protein